MAICAMMCGFDTWSEITLFAQEREPWFRRWLSLPGGIPSHDTFNRIFATLPPASLKSIFQAWIGDIMGDDKLVGQLAVDGKALRATAKGRGANAVHMVNVWSTELGMCVGQQKVADKSNEITAIPELLQLLELKGCLEEAMEASVSPLLGQNWRRKKAWECSRSNSTKTRLSCFHSN